MAIKVNNTTVIDNTRNISNIVDASFTGNVVLGDAGTDTTTLNSQLSANASVGTAGQVLTSRGAGQSPQWTNAGGGITIVDETTNATRYITFTDQTTGSENTLNITSASLNFNPSTGVLNASGIFYNHTSGIVTTISSAAPNMNLAISDAFMITVTATTTFTFTNPPASGRTKFVTLELINGGSFGITWPTNTRWPGGITPSLSTGVDIVTFYTDDGGANYRAALVHRDSK